MTLLFIVFIILVLMFGFVLLFGAPYLPSHTKQGRLALDLLDLKPGQTLYELGCGDGHVLRMCAKRGVKAVGIELNPVLFMLAYIWCWKYRSLITVKFGSFWKVSLQDADAVYVFLLDRFMAKLDKKLQSELRAGTCVASYVFKIPTKKPYKQDSAVFIYKY